MERQDVVVIGSVRVRKTSVMLVPLLMASAIGWLLYVIYFGKLEHELRTADAYSTHGSSILIYTFPFWFLVFVTPLAVILLKAYAVSGSTLLGVVAQVVGVGYATTLGAVLVMTVISIHTALSVGGFDPKSDITYFIVGLTGQIIMFLSLVAMLGAVPFLLSRYRSNQSFGDIPFQQLSSSPNAPIMQENYMPGPQTTMEGL